MEGVVKRIQAGDRVRLLCHCRPRQLRRARVGSRGWGGPTLPVGGLEVGVGMTARSIPSQFTHGATHALFFPSEPRIPEQFAQGANS